MNDLEVTRLCAEAMGYGAIPPAGPTDIILFVKMPRSHPMLPDETRRYDPLHDDAQAMALVKKFNPMMHNIDGNGWTVAIEWNGPNSGTLIENQPDLNRAICECVAKMQQAKGAA